MDRVPQRLAARSRRTPTLLICPCCSGLFNHRSPSPYLRVEFEDYEDIWTAVTREKTTPKPVARKEAQPHAHIIPSSQTLHRLGDGR
jgi:hypothetical protein